MTAEEWISNAKQKAYNEGCLRGIDLAIRMLDDGKTAKDLEYARNDEFYFRAMMADYFPEDYE